ncbi:tRNA1(Val) (adenine(37)-N6)-methyltransferase [Cytospora mali]|uniref:tRNA1(Val) (Adenine(37)-N6)-methyltransferase n=1 Tax=Cytospora mali TaxID=578113 RepID=A0A194UX52_CYTMA|nr:tRNA1(Val) (adenine(37)-N6)-methyltransferase [Valsa mali var. pyri (nom. inval.)]
MDEYTYPDKWTSGQNQQGLDPLAQHQAEDASVPYIKPEEETIAAPRGPFTAYALPRNQVHQNPIYKTPIAPPFYVMTTNGSTAVVPALDFNGYILHASNKPVPEELMRMSSGASVAEAGSVFDEESGRTYHNHNTGKYFFPNDPAEQDRLDLQHKLFKLYHDGALYRAPVQSPKNVLDVATGTGIWAIQFANQHPDANVIGTDLSLIQPPDAAENCSFIKENSEYDEWVYEYQEPFDFIFMRLVNSCFDNHRTVFKKAFDNLQPGGWIELNDATFELLCTDGSIEGTNIQKWSERIFEAAAACGRDFKVPKKYKQWLIDIGFVDVVEEVGPMPGNPWPSEPKYQELGRWQMTNFYRGLRGMSFKLLRAIGMTPDAIEEFIDATRADIRDTGLHFSFPIYVVYGRKPFEWEIGQNMAPKTEPSV